MIALALYTVALLMILVGPALVAARYLEWRAADTDRRIARLRARRLS